MKRSTKWAITIAASLALISSSSAYAAVGYQSRGCGFDMDDDDRVGENGTQKFCQGGSKANHQCSVDADCPSSTCATTGSTTNQDCNVCDGVTTDPDGDGDPEDQVYVDCNSGNDTTGDGTPGTPYKSLSKALSVIDGAGDGNEDIICVRATCSQENGSGVNDLTISTGGVNNKGPQGSGSNTYNEVAAYGNDGWAYRYPSDPMMIVGWDTDNDGEYPPYDPDQSEPAIFDAYNAGQSGAAQYADFLTMGAVNNVELAHFTVKNYGRQMAATSGHVFEFGSSGGAVKSHHFLHDLVLDSIWRGTDDVDGRRGVYWNASSTNGWDYTAFQNVHWKNHGAWISRGHNKAGDHTRHKNITVEEPVAFNSSNIVLGFRLWAHRGIEFVNSRFVAGPLTNTTNAKRAVEVEFLTSAHVAGNEFIDFSQPLGLSVHDDAGWGAAGPYTISRNLFTASDGVTDLGTSVVFFGADAGSPDGQERSECNAGCVVGTTGTCATDPTGTNPAGNSTDCDCDASAVSYLDDVNITDNIFDFNDLTDVAAAVVIQQGTNCNHVSTAGTGPFTIANNTIKNYNPSATSERAAIMVGRTTQGTNWDWKYITGDVLVYNNIFTGLNADYAIINRKSGADGYQPLNGQGDYIPGTDFFANKNVYQGSTVYFGLGVCANNDDCSNGGTCALIVDGEGTCRYTGLTAWQTETSQEANALTCTPDFEVDGYHLDPDEDGGCNVVDNGDNTNCSAYDIDLDARPINTTCDIGADEVATAGGGSSPGSIQLAASSYSTTEGGSDVTVSVTRTGGTDGAASVDYVVNLVSALPAASCDGSATKDYTTTTGTLNWTNGDAATKTFTIATCADSTIEGTETASIVLSNATGAALSSPASATFTILDSSSPVGNSPYFNTTDGVKTACQTTDAATLTIPSVAVTGGPEHPDRVLFVTVAAEAAYNASLPLDPNCDLSLGGASVTRNGDSLVRAVSRVGNSGTTQSECSAIFYQINPDIGSYSVVVTFPGTVTDAQGATFNIYGAAQSAPAVTSSSGGGNTGLSQSTNIATTITDSLIVDALGLGDRVGGGNGLAGGGQVERADVSCDSTGSHLMVSTRETPTPATIPIAWSWASGSPVRQAHSLVAWPAVQSVITTTTTTTNTVTTTTLPAQQAPTQGWRCVGPCVPSQ